jgi:hypothetical protein
VDHYMNDDERVVVAPGVTRGCGECSIGDLTQARALLIEANEGAALRMSEPPPGEREMINERKRQIARLTAKIASWSDEPRRAT